MSNYVNLNELKRGILNIATLARTNQEKALMGRILYYIDNIDTIREGEVRPIKPGDYEDNQMLDHLGALPCWIEYKNTPEEDGWSIWTFNDFKNNFYTRPWTSKPTDEQKKRLPWEK